MTNLAQHRKVSNGRASLLDIGLASLLVTLWLTTLVGGLRIPLANIHWGIVFFGVLIRTFLHTGLFIVTHEAIHRNISKHYFLNDVLGHLTACLYALLSYTVLAKNHRLHHQFPGTLQDPDSAYPHGSNYFVWYFKFMKNYQTNGQAWISVVGMAIIFCILCSLHVPVLNLVLFWIIPMVASSFQLFTFGIFLPHRHKEGQNPGQHQAISTNLPVFWSFVTCYHFGYHWEHHQYPYLPWYQLPQAYLYRKA